jgi:hypothetical protein
MAHGRVLCGVAALLAGSAVATAVPARGLAAKPDGKKGCKTAGKCCDWCVGTTLHTQGARSEKNRDHLLGDDPRGHAPAACRETPAPRELMPGLRSPGLRPLRLGRQGLRRPAGARRTGIDTAGFGPAVFAALSVSGDVSGGYVYSAIAGPPRGTRDCNTGLGDGWGEMVSRSL